MWTISTSVAYLPKTIHLQRDMYPTLAHAVLDLLGQARIRALNIPAQIKRQFKVPLLRKVWMIHWKESWVMMAFDMTLTFALHTAELVFCVMGILAFGKYLWKKWLAIYRPLKNVELEAIPMQTISLKTSQVQVETYLWSLARRKSWRLYWQ